MPTFELYDVDDPTAPTWTGSLPEFLAANPNLDQDDVDAAELLEPGEYLSLGGGAGGLFELRCLRVVGNPTIG